jgi:formylglycine-generating enzyme required for sulfatase activity
MMKLSSLVVIILAALLLFLFFLACNDSKIEELVYIEGGSFLMGDLFDEGNSYEKPLHTVELSDYYLGKFEVTVENFKQFVNETGYKTSAEGPMNENEQEKLFNEIFKLAKSGTKTQEDYIRIITKALSYSGTFCFEKNLNSWTFKADMNWQNPYYDQSDRDPVTCMSWNDAVHYCNWLSKKNGLPIAYDTKTGDLLDENRNVTLDTTQVRGYRLPTEAEWEYAARERGKKIRFGNGKNMAGSADMNFNASAGDYPFLKKGEYRKKLIPVGSFEPNELGLYNMAGNVWEWCSDFVTPYSAKKQINPFNTGSFNGVYRRAARGGRWAGDADELRVSKRLGWQSFNRCNNTGFRVARSR